jgi:alkaline phosphatase D
MLGAEQEAWLYDALRRPQRAGTAWRLLGQQVIFAPFVPQVGSALEVDNWEGYPAARSRFFDCVEHDRIADVAVLTGDIHSSWALDLPRSPLSGYDAATGRGSLAVEIITPAVTSPPFFSRAGSRERRSRFHSASPHMRYMDGDRRGYVTLDITARAAARRLVSRAHGDRAHRRRDEGRELRVRARLARLVALVE